jgi:TPR repeat protein
MSTKNDEFEKKINLAHSLYCDGRYVDSFMEYLSLAEQGHSDCQTFVGWMYFAGKGVDKSLAEAEHWLLKANEANDPEAQFYLGKLYASKGNYALAFKWYEISSNNGYFPATHKLGVMYDQGKGVRRNEDLAIELYKKASSSGHVYSKKEFALKLLKGKRGGVKIIKGIILYLSAGISAAKIAARDMDDERLRV